MSSIKPISSVRSRHLPGDIIFLSRWLQAPLYLGLVVAQAVYVYRFMVELWHLVVAAPGISETAIMLTVLGLIDVVMIANLMIMVIVGGYETFVSRLHLEEHPDKPEWLSHVNAGLLKVKLATALIGISSINLLKTFIEADKMSEKVTFWQVTIHLTFVVSALLLAVTDWVTTKSADSDRKDHNRGNGVGGTHGLNDGLKSTSRGAVVDVDAHDGSVPAVSPEPR